MYQKHCVSIVCMPDLSATRLNLWKKQLGNVPEWVWERTDLETLILADNGLSEVSERMGLLRNLRTAFSPMFR